MPAGSRLGGWAAGHGHQPPGYFKESGYFNPPRLIMVIMNTSEYDHLVIVIMKVDIFFCQSWIDSGSHNYGESNTIWL